MNQNQETNGTNHGDEHTASASPEAPSTATDNVVELPAAQPSHVVQVLRELLARAEAGQISVLLAGFLSADGTEIATVATDSPFVTRVGLCEMIKANLFAQASGELSISMDRS